MKKYIFRGNTINAQPREVIAGDVIELYDPDRIFPNDLEIERNGFKMKCAFVGHKRDISYYWIIKIIDLFYDFTPNEIKRMKKSELIDYANTIGKDVNDKMTKAQIYEVLDI